MRPMPCFSVKHLINMCMFLKRQSPEQCPYPINMLYRERKLLIHMHIAQFDAQFTSENCSLWGEGSLKSSVFHTVPCWTWFACLVLKLPKEGKTMLNQTLELYSFKTQPRWNGQLKVQIMFSSQRHRNMPKADGQCSLKSIKHSVSKLNYHEGKLRKPVVWSQQHWGVNISLGFKNSFKKSSFLFKN